jgi:hypothetical protein
MISPGRVMLNEELLVYRLDGESGSPEKVHSRAHLRQNSEMGFQPPTQYGRLRLALAMLDRCLRDDQEAFLSTWSSASPITFRQSITVLRITPQSSIHHIEMYIAVFICELYISLIHSCNCHEMESINRQNELEHQQRLQELGPTICKLLDRSTTPLKIRVGLKKKRKRSQRFRFYFERKVAAMLSLSVSRRPFANSAGLRIGVDSNDCSSWLS